MCVCDACLFYVSCSDCVGFCGNVCCVAAVVKGSVFFILGVLKYVVCLCLVCILWQFMTCSLSMLAEVARGDHMEEAYSEPVS